MLGCLGSFRRRLVAGAIAVAAASWTAPTQAATAASSSVVPVSGHPAVTVLQTDHVARHAGSHQVLRALPRDAAALAEAKRRAELGVSSPPTSNPPLSSSPAPAAGLSNGLDKSGISAAEEGYCCTPPDTTGAIGPSQYVEFVNTTISVYDRSLNQLSQLDMASFAGAPSGLNVSDPQIQWDPSGGRWFYAGVAFASHNNNLIFGWSKTGDPTDLNNGWCHFGVALGNFLPDYPKLGHDDNFVTFGANLYDDTTGSYVFTSAAIWALRKPAVGSTACAASALTAFGSAANPLRNADGSLAFTPVPANTSDSSPVGYIVAAHTPAPDGSNRIGPQTKVMAWHTALVAAAVQLVADGDLTVNTFDTPPNVPQPSGSPIDSLDARLTQAVAHTDPDAGGAEAVWAQHTVQGASGRSVMRWYELVPATHTVRQQGEIQSPTDYVFNGSISPSIAGNDAAAFYNHGSASQLVVAAAQSRVSSTPLGTMSVGELVLGNSSDADIDLSCSKPYGPPCRWGDYSGASPDPVSAGVVWGSNQVNGPSVLGFPQWQTINYAVTTSGVPPPAPTPCTSVTLSFNPASPQTAGAAVTLAASATGCPNPSYQFWVQAPGGSWQVLQAYSTSHTATWNTTGLAAGTYLFDVWALDASSSAQWDAHLSPNPTYTLQAAPACTAVSLNFQPASPQPPGTTITLTAAATGCPSPTYEFWVQPPGGSWQVLQAYSPSASLAWNTAGLAAGTYLFDVHARQAGSTAAFEAHLSPAPGYTLQTPAPVACTSVTLSAAPASPQAPGTSVTFTAATTGCSSPTYQFWVQTPGGSWQILQAYSASASATWNTAGLAAGTYNLDVWARQASSTADWEAHLSPNPTYTLQAAGTCSSVALSASPASPQAPGTSVTFTAAAAGCSSPTYQFWLQPPGGGWQVLQAYSASAQATWNTAGLAGGTYTLDVYARQAGSSAAWEAHISPNPSYVLAASGACTSVTFSASPASPQAPGPVVTLSAVAGGCAQPTYQFWIQPPGGAWQVLQAYSSSSTVSWNTAGLATGTYLFDVYVRRSGSTAAWEAHIAPNPTYTLQAGSACTSVTLSANPPSPQPSGTSVTLTAAAAGCTNPVYQFWVQSPSGSWQVIQAYSAATTASWSTAGLATGTYHFDAYAKQSGSSAAWEAHLSPSPAYTLTS